MRHTLASIAILLLATNAIADWPTLGGSSARHGQSDQLGPSDATLLWEGASETAWFGDQCFIEDGRVATMRFQSISIAPIVCHDLETGFELWQRDFPGVNSRSVPRGFKDGFVYATNFQESGADTLYALNASDGSIAWVSEVFCERGIVWTASFTENGDLVVPITGNDLARVDHTDGSAVWITERNIPNTGAEGTCIFGGKVYGFEGFINTDKTVTAWDAETGVYLYSSAGLPGDGDQEVPMTLGPDGTIYVKRDGGALYALQDTGEGFTILWASPLGHVFYSGHIGVGIDGSVYMADGAQIVRLDPATGAELDRSASLVSTSTLNPRFVIDNSGTLFVGNGGSTDGRLFSFAPDLSQNWSLMVPGLTRGGPAMGRFGTLVIAGNGFELMAFRSDGTDVAESAPAPFGLSVWPNPFNPATQIEIVAPVGDERRANVAVYDLQGRLLDELYSGSIQGGELLSFNWRAQDAGGNLLPSGVYLLRARLGDELRSSKLVLVE